MEPTTSVSASASSRRHTCDVCQHSFQFQYELKHHRVVHLPKSLRARFPCNQCPKQFVNRKGLKLHLRMHEGAGLKCKDCGKRFATRWYLDTHRRVHTGEKPFSCEVCGRGFSQRANMVRHASTHQDKRERHTFGCDVCQREFLRHDSLISHRTATHGIAASKPPHIQPSRPARGAAPPAAAAAAPVVAVPAPAPAVTDRAHTAACPSSFAAPIPRIAIPMSSSHDVLACSTTSLRAPQRLHQALGGPQQPGATTGSPPLAHQQQQQQQQPAMLPVSFQRSPSSSPPTSPASTAPRSPSNQLFGGSSDLHDHQRLQLQGPPPPSEGGAKGFSARQTPDSHAATDPFSYLVDDRVSPPSFDLFSADGGGAPAGVAPLPLLDQHHELQHQPHHSQQPPASPDAAPTLRCNCGFDADLRGNFCGGCGTILRATSSRDAFYLRPVMVM